MDAKAILEDLFETSKSAAKKGVTLAEEKLGVPESGENRDVMLSGMTKGALAAGAVALLLGTKGGRSLTGTAVKLGGLAAVGGLAYKAYNDWQSGQPKATMVDTGTPIGDLAGASADARSRLLLKAMISAARVDGHIDSAEQQRIQRQIGEFELDQEAANFIMSEIESPLDPAELASSASTPEEAAEIYLASAMVVDPSQRDERRYLDRLAGALGLAPDLAEMLENQLQQA